MELSRELIHRHVTIALAEDLEDRGDVTTRAVLPSDREGTARIRAKEDGVLAGMALVRATFRELDASCDFRAARQDGESFRAGDVLLEVRGKAVALLAAERTALNFLQRLSGIATLARRFVEEVHGTGAVVLETRKTTPGLRTLEKYAVEIGGGQNHRFGLFDRVLLKENHFALSGFGMGAQGYEKTVARAVAAAEGLGPVIAEVRSLAEAEGALRGGADILMLDNMDIDELRGTVPKLRELARRLGREVALEASGGISLENARRIAEAGVDRLSIGALTHSVPSIDVSMLVENGDSSS